MGVLEYCSNKWLMSSYRGTKQGFYLVFVSKLSCYHETIRSSDKCLAHNTLKLIVNPEEYEFHLNNVFLVAIDNVTDYVDI